MRHEHALAHLETAVPAGDKASAATLDGTNLTFVNELGSTAAFAFNGGAISGTYTSKVSSGGGTISGPITGWYNGYVIAWSVVWPTATPAATSWTGALTQSGGDLGIETLWYLSTQTSHPGDPTQFWNAINAGADTFTQQ